MCCSRSWPMQLRSRKVANIESVAPDIVAAGNIGCITQIRSGTPVPVVHTVELLDWASGRAEAWSARSEMERSIAIWCF